MQYFSHDVNALSDPKIQAMVEDYGFISYGFWWVIVEMLARDESNRLALDKITRRQLRRLWNLDDDSMDKFFTDMVNEYDLLFIDDEGRFGSKGLDRRVQMAEEKAESKRRYYAELGRKSGESRRAKKTKRLLDNSEHTLNVNERTLNDDERRSNDKLNVSERAFKTVEHNEHKINKINVQNEMKENETKENKKNRIEYSEQPPAVPHKRSAVVDFYMKNVGQINSILSERLNDLISDYGEAEVLDAFKNAHERGKASIGYVSKILENRAYELAKETPVQEKAGSKYPTIFAAEMEET